MIAITQKMNFEVEDCVVVFGNFDGVHLGHQFLINEAISKAKTLGVKSAVFTFRPHPTYVVMGKDEKDIIFTPEEKTAVVASLGVDYYIEYPFTMEVAKTAAENFVHDIIVNSLHAKCVVVGDDFKFGSRRAGDVALLEMMGAELGFEVMAYNKVCDHERSISSTWVREVVKEGDMAMFEELTGRYFPVVGVVEHGRAIGRTIGFPTANVMTQKSKILPPNGVYASYTTVKGTKYKSITNVGKKPGTVSDEMVVETYILDFDEMIYGETIQIDIAHFIREEYVLESLEHLKQLIKKDLIALESFFESL